MQAGEDISQLLDTAVARHQAGRLAEAEALYAQVLRQDSRQPDALNLMAVLLAQHGRIDEAIEMIRAAIVEQPDNFHFRFNHGHILELAGNGQAAAAYRESLTINPQHLPALINLGNILVATGKPGEAVNYFNRAISIDPTVAQAHEGLGVALQQKQDYGGALDSFQRALMLDPGSVEATANVGTLLIELGRAGEAPAHLRRALNNAPERADLWTNLAIALQAAGETAEALESAKRAQALDPGNSRAIAILGLLLAASGESAEAAAIFDTESRLRSRLLATIPGYADLVAFNEALGERLRGLSSLAATSYGAGSGELSRDKDPALQTLLATIEAEAEAYFAASPRGAYDPVPPPSWKVTMQAQLLGPGVVQEPKLNPAAVLSGRYTVEASEEGAGDLTFGVTPARYGRVELPRHTVTPVPGQLLLFPGYFWRAAHGPESETRCTVVAFDVVPGSA